MRAFEGRAIGSVTLTVGMARSKALVDVVTHDLSGMPCGITVYSGENEMVAIAGGREERLSATKRRGTVTALRGRRGDPES